MRHHVHEAHRSVERGRGSPASNRGALVSRRNLLTAGMLAPAAALLASCGESGSAPSGTLRVMDSYNNSPEREIIGDFLEQAADRIGVRLQRTPVSGASLIQRVLQQGSSDTLPDILMLDNPDLQQIAATTALRPLQDVGVPTEGYHQSVLEAGTYDGDVYGLAPTVNTIALFCNVAAFEKAGVEFPRSWEETRAAAEALTEGSQYGIAFCSAPTYEGTWQFLPFFWSNGADERDIASPEAAEALGFMSGFVHDGSASSSVLNWTQADVKDQFVAGRAAMMINGPWQLPAMSEEDVEYEIVTLPLRDPGSQEAVAPLGGEVWTVPATGDSAREAVAGEVLSEFLSDESILAMAEQRFTVPGKPSLTDDFLKVRPDMATFADLIPTAQARTARLEEDWPLTATALYTAMQLSVSGQESPQDALSTGKEYV